MSSNMNIRKKSLVLIILFLSSSFLTGCIRKNRDDPNTEIRTLLHDGITRSYRIHIPPDTDEYSALLLALHGGSGTAEHMEEELIKGEFNRLSDEQGFIVVYPDGIEKRWNDGRKINNPVQHIDDVGFLSLLIENLTKDFAIDQSQVFMTGISNGGQMSYKMACDHPEKLGGIAVVASSLHESLYMNCTPTDPISVFIIMGTDDPLVPYDGGMIWFLNRNFGKVKSINETVQFWVQSNRCLQQPTVIMLPDSDPNDGCRVTTYEYPNGNENTSVLFYSIDGGGHTWPGGGEYFIESLVGRVCYDFNACDHIWNFFD